MINTFPIEKISQIRMSSLKIFHNESYSMRWNRHIKYMMDVVKKTQNPYVLAFTLKFAARFYFKRNEIAAAIKLIEKVLQIYPRNHRLMKSAQFDLYRYQLALAENNGGDPEKEENLLAQLRVLEKELRKGEFSNY